MAYAAKGCKTKGFLRINIIGVEGEENKIPIIKEHLSINGFRENNDELSQMHNGVFSKIIHGVITENDGIVEFPVVDLEAYGASMLHTIHFRNNEKTKVYGYSIKTLIKDFNIVDFIHIDIQGYEFNVIKSSIKEINKKVRYICIGTHSRKIEGDLIEFLCENGWILHREMPCLFIKKTMLKEQLLVDLTTLDGTQFWENERLQSEPIMPMLL